MISDPFPCFDTLSQKQLGEIFGVSSHVVGRWLKEIGMRFSSGEPTPDAIAGGIAVQVDPGGDMRPFWAWSKEKIVVLLAAAGKARAGMEVAPVVPPQLSGPFTIQPNQSESDGFEIADGNGVVAIWCRGEWLAGVLEKLLNLCHRTKKYFQ